MSQARTIRIADVAAFLTVSDQRVAQMHQEGKPTKPKRVDRIGPVWGSSTSAGPSASGGGRDGGGTGLRQERKEDVLPRTTRTQTRLIEEIRQLQVGLGLDLEELAEEHEGAGNEHGTSR